MDRVAASVKKLRSLLGDSQQAFAQRLGLSVRAIANYEAGRRPSSVALFKLGKLAAINNLVDLAGVFSSAYVVAVRGRTEPIGQERVLVRIVLSLSRNQEFVRHWSELSVALVDSLTELANSLARLEGKTRGDSAIALRTNLKELYETLDEAQHWIREQQLESRVRELSKKTSQPFFCAYLQVLREDPAFSSQYAEAMAEFGSVRVQPKQRRPEDIHPPEKK